jgi:O-antigen/teichoic acid export membrane protein
MGERAKKFLWGLGSSYILVAASILYTLASIPLALHFLAKEEFGLWALVTQLASYMNLMDMGMQSSTARIFINYKDSKSDGQYGSLVKTSAFIFSAQGLLVLLVGLPLIPFVGHFLSLPLAELSNFQTLMGVQIFILAVGFSTRTFGCLLHAHQQYVWSNIGGAIGQLLGLASLAVSFHFGHGLFSLVTASVVAFLSNNCVQILGCLKLKLLPASGGWGSFQLTKVKILFDFAKDTFLMSLGWQLISATPIVLISKVIGLDAAATWSVGTKLFTLFQQIIWKILDNSAGGFAEMFVRSEYQILRVRFFEITSLTAFLSPIFAGLLIVCNSPFVSLWTSGKISWPILYNIPLALLLVSYSVGRCYGSLPSITMGIGFARYVYFLDGLLFCLVGFFILPSTDLVGLIVLALLLDLALPGFYGINRTTRLFGLSLWEVFNQTWARYGSSNLLSIILTTLFLVSHCFAYSWIHLFVTTLLFISLLSFGFVFICKDSSKILLLNAFSGKYASPSKNLH